MQELIDANNSECIGFVYTVEESKAAIFALSLYSSQLAAGRIIDNPEENEDAVDLIRLNRELQREFESGLLVVDPGANEALKGIFFPYVYQMHKGLTPKLTKGVCAILGVTYEDLSSNSLVAERIMYGPSETVSID